VAAAVPDATVDFVPAGHLPWAQPPEQVGAIVHPFLDRRRSVKAMADASAAATNAAELSNTASS
jgi:hypothetical protein